MGWFTHSSGQGLEILKNTQIRAIDRVPAGLAARNNLSDDESSRVVVMIHSPASAATCEVTDKRRSG